MKRSASKPRRAATPKQRVVKRFPKAECHRYNGFWAVYGNVKPGIAMGYHRRSRTLAWAMAARSL